jgi:SAM-dependent methyltransferase
VEYLTRPVEVFREVARVLRPGGIFVNTFSDRWFPPKAISLWGELTEFERMGLVGEYFMQTGAYENLNTYSARGWSRPEDDRYYSENPVSDPLYAVWAEKAT